MNDKQLPVHLYVVLDMSGSMHSLAEDLIGGFNSLIMEQLRKPGLCRVTTVLFDGDAPFNVIHDAVKLEDVPKLDGSVYRPRGSTPLLDAEGLTIARAMARQADRKARDVMPEAVLIITYTDGQENTSREFTFESLTKLKRQVEQDYSFTFTYLGVGHDGYAQAERMGTQSVRSSTRHTHAVVGAVAQSASYATSTFRDKAADGLIAGSADLYEGYEGDALDDDRAEDPDAS